MSSRAPSRAPSRTCRTRPGPEVAWSVARPRSASRARARAAHVRTTARARVSWPALLSGSRARTRAARARALPRGATRAATAKTWLRGARRPPGSAAGARRGCARASGGEAVAAPRFWNRSFVCSSCFSSKSTREVPGSWSGSWRRRIAAPTAAAAAAATENGRAARASPRSPPRSSPSRAFFCIAAFWKNWKNRSARRPLLGSRSRTSPPRSRPRGVLVKRRSSPPRRRVGPGPGGVFAGSPSRRARARRRRAAFAAFAAAATRRCVPMVARAHVDKVTAEAMFGTKAKAE